MSHDLEHYANISNQEEWIELQSEISSQIQNKKLLYICNIIIGIYRRKHVYMYVFHIPR